ncbi:Pentatricopeptide repeat-containing protein [Platanthera guangdongensis]|uniref:Pentatricopeptide repeat-containing protein n=1 Tax=Platanthera guangdongensis TaxID=2320717 RepID=A0ABR2M402_9ASPA
MPRRCSTLFLREALSPGSRLSPAMSAMIRPMMLFSSSSSFASLVCTPQVSLSLQSSMQFRPCNPLSLESAQLHGYLIKYQLDSETATGSSLCTLYSKCGRLEHALKAFRMIPNKNVISWTTVISACRDNGRLDLGLKIFHKMLLEDEVPNEFTLASALSLCTETRSFALGKQVHAF